MTIIINVPYDEYAKICAGDFDTSGCFKLNLRNAFRNGTLLPKGHDRLIYADDVKENHKRWIGYLDEDMIARLNIAIDKHIPTIIEADKKGDDKSE